MKRRHFLLTAASAATLPSIGLAAKMQYHKGLVDAELAAGNTVFADFYTSWCSTCAAQKRVITALMAADPAYEREISFVAVDWDIYSNGQLARRLNIPRRSTLVVLKGDQELGRIVAGTRKRNIKALMDLALNAALA